MTDTSVIQDRIGQLCGQFKLPTVGAQSVTRFTAAGHGDALPTFLEVLEQEAEDRRQRRIVRLRQRSKLPSGKTWETFEYHRMPLALRQQLDHLAQGSFVERGVNVLAFGLPSTGKTHARCASGHRPVEAGHSGLFRPGLPPGAGTPGRQARPLAAATITKARQLRFPAAGRPGVPAPRGRRVQGALQAHRLTLRAPVPGHHIQPGLLPVGAHLRQPNGHGGGHRPGGPPLGHP